MFQLSPAADEITFQISTTFESFILLFFFNLNSKFLNVPTGWKLQKNLRFTNWMMNEMFKKFIQFVLEHKLFEDRKFVVFVALAIIHGIFNENSYTSNGIFHSIFFECNGFFHNLFLFFPLLPWKITQIEQLIVTHKQNSFRFMSFGDRLSHWILKWTCREWLKN